MMFEKKIDGISQPESWLNISQKQEDLFQTLIETTSALIFVVVNRKICYVNPIVESTIGYSRSQLSTDLSFYNQLNPDEYEPHSLQPRYCNELKINTKNNDECWLNCQWSVIKWKSQPAILITGANITAYKQQQTETVRALATQKELYNNKLKFVSMVSHELRSPLNIISFSTSLLKRHFNQWNETKKLEYFDRLQTAVGQLGNLMDEVLLIGRAESGKIKLNPQLLNVDTFCHELLAEIKLSQSDTCKINFVNQLERKTVVADNNLLKLVLVNLIGNAVKYSPEGSAIELIVTSDSQQIVFKVVDRGRGIPKTEQPFVFEPFYRSSNVGNSPGSGLGLAIVKKMVELQSGRILLESKVNQGSTFIIKMPLKSSLSAMPAS